MTILIQNSKHEIGDEIDSGLHGKLHERYRVTIKKVSDDEWIAYKHLFVTGKETVLRRGNLWKILDYVNRNFGYNDEAVD